MTGTPIENRLGELWAIMDIVNPGLLGSRERFERTFARPIEAYGDDARARAAAGDRAAVHPPAREGRARGRAGAAADHGRRRTTAGSRVEQASLYRATVDRWLPRIEEHERPLRPPRRGARDAEPAEAGLQPPRDGARRPGSPLDGRSGKLERLVELLERGAGRRQGARLHAVPGLRPARPAPRSERLGRERRLLPRPPRAPPARRVLGRVRHAGGPVGARDLDPRRRPRAEPARPRTTSSTSTAGGTRRSSSRRPTAPTASASASTCSCTASSAPATLEERIDQLLESKRELAEKVIAGARRGLARRARPRRDPRRRDALGRGGGGGMKVLNDGRPVFAGGQTIRSGAAPGPGCSRPRSSATRARRAPSGGGSWPGPVTSTRSWSTSARSPAS